MAAMLVIGVVPAAFGAQRLSNEGIVDGIDSDPESGIHNSYAWCTQLFEQTDGEYLWVGTNRDLGGTLLGAALGGDPALVALSGLLDIPVPSTDNMGKIYRYSIDAFEPKWELMYEDPAINGYRKMLIYKGDLYVFAGLSNRGTGYNYSVVFRFGADFKPGDTPEVVLWETLTGGMLEYFRAAYVFQDTLYVGTFDSKIYCTTGEGLTSLTPNRAGTGPKSTGWTLAADLTTSDVFDNDDPGQSYVWDLIGFNGCLYAFITGQGFRVYKLTPDSGSVTSFTIKQIVGKKDQALLPPGLGLNHVAASPFVFSQYGDYVYVSTFANGPTFLVEAALGNISGAFNDIYCPATMYRFDKDDNWEVVVGDKIGDNVAVDKTGTKLPIIGDSRAGFFPGEDCFPNISANQYIWWMAEYNGKLYASTWDMGIFRDYLPLMILNILIQSYGMDTIASLQPLLEDLSEKANALCEELVLKATDEDFAELPAAIGALVCAFEQELAEICDPCEIEALACKLVEDIAGLLKGAMIDVSLVEDFNAAIVNFIEVAVPTTDELKATFVKTITAIFASALYYLDNTNPAGFDLFVSDDGLSFSPFTVNGLDSATNYGGRVLLPTPKGLFLTTANPFKGCQVWRLDDVASEIRVDLPQNVEMKVGGTQKFYVKSIKLDPNDISVSVNGSQYMGASITMVKELTPVTEYNSTVTKVCDPLAFGGWKYQEQGVYTKAPVYLYEVTLKGLKAYEGDMDISIRIGGVTYTGKMNVKIKGIAILPPTNDPTESTSPNIPRTDDNRHLALWSSVAVICLLFVGLLIFTAKYRTQPVIKRQGRSRE